jgi:hypothetical protein
MTPSLRAPARRRANRRQERGACWPCLALFVVFAWLLAQFIAQLVYPE